MPIKGNILYPFRWYYRQGESAATAEPPGSPVSGGIPEAPIDGQLYGRKDADWSVIPPDTVALIVSSMNVFIETPAAKTYVLDLDAPAGYTITKISLQLSAGTCTAALLRNGSPITGAASIAVSTTLASVTLSQAASIDDNISLAISSPSGATDLSVAVRTTQ